jgi:uncharacterized protein (DUF3084 family)
MRCYLVRDSQVTVLSQVPKSPDADTDFVQSIRDLNQSRFPATRLLSIWNALPGAEPVKRFKDRATGVKRVWAALEPLPLTTSGTFSKQDHVVALLKRDSGASIDDLMAATGWQRHSVRGVLSGVVRKKRGLKLSSSREGGRLVYRVVA